MASRRDKPFLPSELITNILKRLPIKSIVRFQCVCKEWKNLFKTHSFVSEHYHFHSDHKNPFLLLHEYHSHHSLSLLNHEMETVESLSIPSIDSFRHSWRIIGSCNGLLCVRVVHHPVRCPPLSSILLWNPLIREVREIPLTNIDYLGFSTYGFGFSSIVNDYKIVRFYDDQELRKKKEDQLEHCPFYDGVEVFSLSTGSWKQLEFEFGDFSRGRYLSEPVNVDGTISWLGIGHISPMIISFNVATEVFTLTPTAMLTSEPTGHRIQFGLGLYDNKLEVHFMIHEFSGPRFFSVWVMEEVASESGKSLSPSKKYRFGPTSGMLVPKCIWENEIVCIHEKVPGEGDGTKCDLYLFNLITNERRKFNCSNSFNGCDVHNYEKSLVSVWHNNQVE